MKHYYGVLCLGSDGEKLLYHLPQKSLKAAKNFVSVMKEVEPGCSYFVTVQEVSICDD